MTPFSSQDQDLLVEALEFWIERLIHDYVEDEELTRKIHEVDFLLQRIVAEAEFTV